MGKRTDLDFTENWKLFHGDSSDILARLPDESIDCCVTSPPYYGLRDYGTGHWEGGDPNCPHYRTSKKSDKTQTGHKAMMENGSPVGDAIYKSVCPLCGAVRVDKQIGLEETPEDYIDRLVNVFHEVKRVLKSSGTCWINIGDSYWGSGNTGKYKDKDIIGIPWMLAFALRADGWYLRQDIVWEKTNCMPENVQDRCTKSHEYIFLLSKKPHYYYDAEEIKNETGSIKRDVWTVPVSTGYTDNSGVHYATYNPKLIEPCILAGCPKGGIVLDPFNGTGTTGIVSLGLSRKYVGIDLNHEYIAMATRRLEKESAQYTLFAEM